MMIDHNCLICFLSPTVFGTVSDITLARESNLNLPDGSCAIQDCGFQGFEFSNMESDVEILQPKKKSKNHPLTPFEKIVNKIISSSRVYIEHVIGSTKRWKSVHDICRLRTEGIHDLLMEICCGLHNFKVRQLPWSPIPMPGEP
jgi:DDE superfamily endonuclease